MSTQKNIKILKNVLTYLKICVIVSMQTQQKYKNVFTTESEVGTMDEMKKSSEKLIEIIRNMSEAEADKLLYLVEGTRIGEATAKNNSAA